MAMETELRNTIDTYIIDNPMVQDTQTEPNSINPQNNSLIVSDISDA
jgi:hypothetical protein